MKSWAVALLGVVRRYGRASVRRPWGEATVEILGARMRLGVRRGLLATVCCVGGGLALVPSAASAATTFTGGSIAGNPTTAGPSSPYPATIAVSGQPLSRVTVTLSNVSSTFLNDMVVVLVGPQGQSVQLLNRQGGSNDFTGQNYTFDDAAGTTFPDPAQSGTYTPSTQSGGSLEAPGPAGPYGTMLSTFSTTNENGTWSLYVDDQAGQDVTDIGSWSLNFTPIDTTPPSSTVTSFTAGGGKGAPAGPGILRGTATDNQSVASIAVRIRNPSGSFDQTYQANCSGCGTANATWSLDLNGTGVPVGPTLTARSIATDTAGNVGQPSAPFTFATKTGSTQSTPPVPPARAASVKSHRQHRDRRHARGHHKHRRHRVG